MKLLPLMVLLLGIAACGDKNSQNQSAANDKEISPLSCAVSSMDTSPVIKIPQNLIDKILVDFQGRTFNRNAFWNILSRETRLDVNLFLNGELKVPEEILFPGFVLFMENYFDHPGEKYLLRTSKYKIRFDADVDIRSEIKSPCGNQDEALSKIDVSRMIPASSEEMTLSCNVNSLVFSHSFSLRFYKNHLIMNVRDEKFLFSGAEIIRNDGSLTVEINTLDPQGRTLSVKFDKNEDGEKKRQVAIHFFGKTTYFDGSGSCTSLQK